MTARSTPLGVGTSDDTAEHFHSLISSVILPLILSLELRHCSSDNYHCPIYNVSNTDFGLFTRLTVSTYVTLKPINLLVYGTVRRSGIVTLTSGWYSVLTNSLSGDARKFHFGGLYHRGSAERKSSREVQAR